MGNKYKNQPFGLNWGDGTLGSDRNLLNNINKYDTSNNSSTDYYGFDNKFTGIRPSSQTGSPGIFSGNDISSINYNANNGINAQLANSHGLVDDPLDMKSAATDPYSELGKPISYLSTPIMPTADRSGKIPVNSNTDLLNTAGNSLGLTGWGDGRSNGTTYQNSDGKWMTSGNITDSASKGTDFGSVSDAQKAGFYLPTIGADGTSIPSTMTDDKFATAKFDQGRLDNQSFQNNIGLGMGAAQLGMGLFSTFGSNGSMAMNKKNMEVMDGQIANNNSIMDTRNARAADIKKYFG